MPRSESGVLERQSMCEMMLTVVSEAGRYANEARNNGLVVKYDASGSPSTNVDAAVSQYIEKRLSATGLELEFAGEEIGFRHSQNLGLRVVIDGIDGTRNYRDGNYGWCISVGLLQSGVPLIGVVHDPYLGESFYAIRESGAFKRIRHDSAWSLRVPSHIPKDFSFSVGSFRTGGTTAKKQNIVAGFKAIGGREREWGCVALSICGVARGGLGAFVQANSFLHDHVAALLIAREAGTYVVEKDAGSPGRTDIMVCHPSLAEVSSGIVDGNW